MYPDRLVLDIEHPEYMSLRNFLLSLFMDRFSCYNPILLSGNTGLPQEICDLAASHEEMIERNCSLKHNKHVGFFSTSKLKYHVEQLH